jgi:hypothetical protein
MALQICDDDIGEIVFGLVGKWVCTGPCSICGKNRMDESGEGSAERQVLI